MLAILSAVYATDMIKFSRFRMIQLAMIGLTTYISLSTDYSLKQKTGLPFVNQMLTWIAFPLSIYLPVNSYKTPLKRFLSSFAGIAPPLILLSVNYEVLFFALLGALMYLWLLVERCIMYEKLRQKSAKESAITVSGEGTTRVDSNILDLGRRYADCIQVLTFHSYFLHGHDGHIALKLLPDLFDISFYNGV